MSSSPKLLFCELMLGKHETKTFEYSELLPFDAPPSYRGKNIRFRYNLLVATQRVGASVEVFKVPFRVISASPFTAEAAAMAAEAIAGKNSPMADMAGLQNGAARLLFENGTFLKIWRWNGGGIIYLGGNSQISAYVLVMSLIVYLNFLHILFCSCNERSEFKVYI